MCEWIIEAKISFLQLVYDMFYLDYVLSIIENVEEKVAILNYEELVVAMPYGCPVITVCCFLF